MPARYCCMPSDYDLQEFVLEVMLSSSLVVMYKTNWMYKTNSFGATEILEVLKNWPERSIQVIVVTDGERILGLEDLGCQGMGIPVGKLSLYTALGGVLPSAEYHELLEEFMTAVKKNYDEKVLTQGTASVVLAGLLAALKVVGGTLADHTYLFLGASEAETGITELIALEMSKQTGSPIEECRPKIWLMDSKGLIMASRIDSLTLKPLIFALSNPMSHSECTAEQAYTWTQGRAVFASGSLFPTVELDGKTLVPGQSNNAYIFPWFGLGVIILAAIRVRDGMLLAASEALAEQVTEEHFAKGLIFPPFTNIRAISAHIATKAYERLPRLGDLVKYAESCMYTPTYRSYR
ncbi:unnamed protein product [Miscanthus lutarioriparius]|uniref:Malic enzyme NAD-binding domain-containing protein n=1 Tax=Miscanthus lutarioriparius TaxID=422564 RepID=A0A811P4Z1_9POAL|nr:unnamed protein product [Miscanthus lutarioriparius]